jgi:hypothetical protein
VTELRDTAIWAATCDLKAQVLRNAGRPLVRAPGHLMLEADGFTYRVAGRALSRAWDDCGEFHVVPARLFAAAHVAWPSADGGRGGAFLAGAGRLPAEDLAVLLNRYRQRYAR